MSVEDRLAVIYETRPELCTLNLGTINYGGFPMIDRYAGHVAVRLGGAVPGEHPHASRSSAPTPTSSTC